MGTELSRPRRHTFGLVLAMIAVLGCSSAGVAPSTNGSLAGGGQPSGVTGGPTGALPGASLAIPAPCSLLTADEIKQVSGRSVTQTGPDPIMGDLQPTCVWTLSPAYIGGSDMDHVEITFPSSDLISAKTQIKLDRTNVPSGQDITGVGDDAYLFFLDGEDLSMVKGDIYLTIHAPDDSAWKAFLPELGKKVATRL